MPPDRNHLGPAYEQAEHLYDNASALVFALDAYSGQGRSGLLSQEAIDHLTHNLINARDRLDRLEQALALPTRTNGTCHDTDQPNGTGPREHPEQRAERADHT